MPPVPPSSPPPRPSRRDRFRIWRGKKRDQIEAFIIRLRTTLGKVCHHLWNLALDVWHRLKMACQWIRDHFATAPPSPVDEDKLPLHVHYKIFRDYIEHEDGLINKRLLWNINIQGFLFATYGFSLQKLAEVEALRKPEMIGVKALYWLVFVLPIFGAWISYLSYRGVIAAQHAISQLKQEWGDAQKQHVNNNQPILPGIIGGGHGKAHDEGFRAPKLFPWIFIAAWIALLLTYVLPIDFKSVMVSAGGWCHWLWHSLF